MIYLKEIRDRLRAEYSRNLSDEEIERCLRGCVWGHILIPIAKDYRNKSILTTNYLITPPIMELLSIDAQLNFKQHSRRRHYIFEEITAEFIHFNAICDIEVERCLTIQERGFDTPPMCDCTDTVHLYNLQCIDNEDDKTVMPFSPEEMEYIKEIIINEIENKLERL